MRVGVLGLFGYVVLQHRWVLLVLYLVLLICNLVILWYGCFGLRWDVFEFVIDVVFIVILCFAAFWFAFPVRFDAGCVC